jgi:hypothetical protein
LFRVINVYDGFLVRRSGCISGGQAVPVKTRVPVMSA